MAPPLKLAHVVFRTKRFDEIVEWYADVLEARVAFRNDYIAFLTYDEEHHRVAVVRWDHGVEPAADTLGLEHVSFTYGSIAELLDTYERLARRGVRPYWAINHGPTTSLYYRDPDGNQIELQVDNFPTVEQLNAYFRTGAFARNPIGVEFDPDELLARHRAGEPEAALLAPSS